MTVGSMARVRVPVWRTLLLGGLTAAVGLMGNALAAFLTEWTGSFGWFAAPGVGVLVAAVMALVQAYGKAHVEDQFPDARAPAPAPGQPYPPYQPYHPQPGARTTAPTKGTPLLAALAITLVVIGVGGFALAWGARFAIGWITGDEDGVDRLTRAVSVEDKGVVVRVETFEETRHFTKLQVGVTNNLDASVTLYLFGNALVTGADGSTLQADAFRSDWPDTVPPGSFQGGEITFKGHLPDGVRRAALRFSHVGAMGFEGPSSLKVEGLRLKPRT
jgi:hypothetical protein